MSVDGALLRSRPSTFGDLLAAAARRPLLGVAIALVIAGAVLAALEGPRDLAQATINGVVAGNYYALGAVGLTLIFGVLRLVNFAHGEFLTFGAYMMLAASSFDVPLVGAVVLGVLATAVFSLFLEDRQTPADVTSSVSIGDLRIGRTELIVTLLGIAVIVLVAVALRWTSLGRQARALSDSIQLAETTGIDTERVVLVTWAVSGGLAGLAGIFYALPAGSVNPNIGFSLILSIFAAVIVGGIGNAYGALAGGLLIGIVQEWSTLVIEPSMKVAVGFAMLILVLLVRPQGLFGRVLAADR
jgi:neutral amino acid transport system permease protein